MPFSWSRVQMIWNFEFFNAKTQIWKILTREWSFEDWQKYTQMNMPKVTLQSPAKPLQRMNHRTLSLPCPLPQAHLVFLLPLQPRPPAWEGEKDHLACSLLRIIQWHLGNKRHIIVLEAEGHLAHPRQVSGIHCYTGWLLQRLQDPRSRLVHQELHQ